MKLFAIKIVAKREFGFLSKLEICLLFLFSLFSSSKSDILREKYEISAPETHAEKTSKIIINRNINKFSK